MEQLYCIEDAGEMSFSVKYIVRVHSGNPVCLGESYPNHHMDSSSKAVSNFCNDMYDFKKRRLWRTTLMDKSWLEDVGYWCFSKDIE